MTLFEPVLAALERAEADGWEQHRRAELESVSLTTPADRLRWLEEAIAFAFRAGALPRISAEHRPPPSDGVKIAIRR